MQPRGMALAALVAAALALAGCRDAPVPDDTAVLGSNGAQAAGGADAKLVDAQGRAIPPPPFPPGGQAQVALTGEESALAVWEHDGQVIASAYSRGGGWGQPAALEQIYGRASDPQLAGNGRGAAMALWRHTVGTIQSLRFSRFDVATGWSEPDVVPGALPRPHVEDAASHQDAPELSMDAQGNVTARWPSGFAAGEEQVARHAPGQGWSSPASEAVAAAPAETTAPAAPAAPAVPGAPAAPAPAEPSGTR